MPIYLSKEGSTCIEFGHGDVCVSLGGTKLQTENSLPLMVIHESKDGCHEIGMIINDKDEDVSELKNLIILFFTNTESLSVFIEQLQKLRCRLDEVLTVSASPPIM